MKEKNEYSIKIAGINSDWTNYRIWKNDKENRKIKKPRPDIGTRLLAVPPKLTTLVVRFLNDNAVRAALHTRRNRFSEGGLKVAKRLLNRNAGNLIQPRKLFGLFKRRQHGRCFVVSDFFFSFKPSVSALAKHVVVCKASAPERPSKGNLLLRGWEKPERVGALNFHVSHHIRSLCKMQPTKPDCFAAALYLPGLKAEVSRGF